ncbi:MAG: signal peptidase I [Clostridia bacterium]
MSDMKPSAVKQIADTIVVIILAIIVSATINAFFLGTVRVKGTSMSDTLYGGGDIAVDKSANWFNRLFLGINDSPQYGDKVLLLNTKKVKRGDIIVFRAFHADGQSYVDPTGQQEQWIKRVIGIAGDEILIKEGSVYVNGELLSEPYLLEPYSTFVLNGELSVKVPEGKLFVMGDNRCNSTDSRRSNVGCIKTKDVIGKVILVLGKQSHKITFPKKLSNLEIVTI